MTLVSLTWEDTAGITHARELTPPVWLGRDPRCDVVIDEAAASRRHACICLVGDELRITDQSANGTRVDGRRLRRATRSIHPPAHIEVAGRSLQLRAVAPATVPPDAEPDDAPIPTPLRRRIHAQLLERLDLARLDPTRLDRASLEPDVRVALQGLCDAMDVELPAGRARARLVEDLVDEALGLGPLERLLHDATVSEIMVVDPATIYVERHGVLELSPARFTDVDSVRAVLERIVTPLGRRIDESVPVVDARLPDGSRVHAIIPPLASRGPCITIRKFSKVPWSLDDLVGHGALCPRMARLLTIAVQARKNVVLSGGTGSGKTTLLNVLSAAIPERERIVTIEDAAELRLRQPHVVSLVARSANLEGQGAYTIRDLVRNALRMRPDRIVVGECRGPEALDMLQAMNTGHDGSMTTTHANSPSEAIARLETLCLMAGLDLPVAPIRQHIAASIDLVVQQTRFADGTRRVTSVSEVVGLADDGRVALADLFRFQRTGTTGDGRVEGCFRPTGLLPSFVGELAALGLLHEGDVP